MRTIYLGDTYRRHRGQPTSYQSRHDVDAMRDPEGDDIPVFDRYATGGRGEYDRPMRDEDRVWTRRIKR